MNYYRRYSRNYKEKCAAAWKQWNQIGKGRCCFCFTKPAKEMHHTSYGQEWLGKNWFPLCISCHRSVAHHPKNWVIYPGKKAVWENHNRKFFVTILQKNYRNLSQK